MVLNDKKKMTARYLTARKEWKKCWYLGIRV
jgi:hypothetical protein